MTEEEERGLPKSNITSKTVNMSPFSHDCLILMDETTGNCIACKTITHARYFGEKMEEISQVTAAKLKRVP